MLLELHHVGHAILSVVHNVLVRVMLPHVLAGMRALPGTVPRGH